MEANSDRNTGPEVEQEFQNVGYFETLPDGTIVATLTVQPPGDSALEEDTQDLNV